jgi:adenine phosphoribosyltransferase
MQRGEGTLFIVDDVLATGGTLTASATLARIAGYDVAALGVLIDLKLLHDYSWEGMKARTVIEY